jgi:hypothetical protein
LKEEALDRTVWRAGFGRGFGPVVRQTVEWWWKTLKQGTGIVVSLKIKFKLFNRLQNSHNRPKTTGECEIF